MPASTRGYEFGRLGLRLEERFDLHLTAKLSLLFGAYSLRARSAQRRLYHVERGRIGGLEAGDFAYASYCHPPPAVPLVHRSRSDADPRRGRRLPSLMGRTKDAITTEMLRVSRQQAIELRGNSWVAPSLPMARLTRGIRRAHDPRPLLAGSVLVLTPRASSCTCMKIMPPRLPCWPKPMSEELRHRHDLQDQHCVLHRAQRSGALRQAAQR